METKVTFMENSRDGLDIHQTENEIKMTCAVIKSSDGLLFEVTIDTKLLS